MVNSASNQYFNPAAYLTVLLPIIPGIALFEWSAWRDRRNASVSVQLVPMRGPRGDTGIAAVGSF